MALSITSNNVTVTDAFKNAVVTKLAKLERILGDAQVDTKVILTKHPTRYTTKVTLIVTNLRPGVPEKIFTVSQDDLDAYNTLDPIEEKLTRQIRKALTAIEQTRRPLKGAPTELDELIAEDEEIDD